MRCDLFLRATTFIVMIACMQSGCVVGPEFKALSAPTTTGYTAGDLPAETAAAPVLSGAAQRYATGQDIPGEWWTLFHSAAIDELIRQALADSPTLAAARAWLREVEENRRAGFGLLFPRIDAGASASRQQLSGASNGQADIDTSPFNLVNASVSVSYALQSETAG